jgi:hypothetical protein
MPSHGFQTVSPVTNINGEHFFSSRWFQIQNSQRMFVLTIHSTLRLIPKPASLILPSQHDIPNILVHSGPNMRLFLFFITHLLLFLNAVFGFKEVKKINRTLADADFDRFRSVITEHFPKTIDHLTSAIGGF